VPKYYPPNKYEEAIDIARDDPDEGVELLRDLAKKYPSDPSVRHALGVTLLELHRPAEALPHFEHALSREDRGSDMQGNIYVGLMMSYGMLGMEIHARRAAKRAKDLGIKDIPEPGELRGDLPQGANEKELLLFEQARFKTISGQSRQGLSDMKAFLKRFPDYMPAHNVMTTGYFLLGDLPNYQKATQDALERAPRNIHALLNKVRLVLLTEGLEAAKTWRERIADAAISKEEKITGGALAQAQAFALLEDDEGVEQALELSYQDEADDDDPVAELYDDILGERKEGERIPYHQVKDLIPGWLKRWQELSRSKQLPRIMKADLETLPGFLEILPHYLGYEEETVARLLAALLLENPDLPAPHGPWPEVLKNLATVGPGEEDTRRQILILLLQKGLISNEEVLPFEGSEAGVKLLELELYTEPEESYLSNADKTRYAKVLEEMRAGKMSKARAALEELLTKYPNSTSLLYNLALAEAHDNTLPKGKERSRDRLEKLVAEHPAYLFAKVQLVRELLNEGNIERAKEILVLPEGVKRFHIDNYTAFMSAQGQLALAEGNKEQAEKILGMLEEMVGEDDSSYRILEQDLKRGNVAMLGKLGNLFKRKRI
jgi:tetratricopeptide (TPR) repeat protein